MKKLLSVFLLVATIIGSFSFETNSMGKTKQHLFKRVTVNVNETYPINGTPCHAVVHITIAVDWDPVTDVVSNINVNPTTIAVQCPGNFTCFVGSSVTTLTFGTGGHITALALALTSDADANTVISDPTVISDLIAKLNGEIDKQIP